MKQFLHPLQLAGLLFLAGIATPVAANERVALIIGNSKYKNAPELENPRNDATSVAAMLAKLDFKVITLLNADTDDFYSGLERFKREASNARVGLFYFAGHGIEVENSNYLIPVDATLERSTHLRTQAINLRTVLQEMADARIPAKMVILDCCRDNPLTRSWMSTRSIGKGLAPVADSAIPQATMILFAAKPGQAALDGEGTNSPFTTALLSELVKPGRNAMDAFLAVSDSVVESTGRRQEPWVKLDGAGRAFRSFSLVPDNGITTPDAEAKPGESMPKSTPPVSKSKPPQPKRSAPGMIVVPQDYSSIQEAIDSSSDGDTILIKQGIYREWINIPEKNKLEIRGEDPASVILRPPSNAEPGKIVTIDSRVAENLKIGNLTFEYSTNSKKPVMEIKDILDSHIQIAGGSAEISNCVFNGGYNLYGIRVLAGKATVTNCEFRDTVSGVQVANADTSAHVIGCEIRSPIANGIIFTLEGQGVAERNTIKGASMAGIAVIGEGTEAEVSDNIIEQSAMSGIELGWGASATISGNKCRSGEGGILIYGKGTSATVTKNECLDSRINGINVRHGASVKLHGNQCDRSGGSGIAVITGDCEVWITDNKTYNNSENGIAVAAACYPKEFSGNEGAGNKWGDVNRNAKFRE